MLQGSIRDYEYRQKSPNVIFREEYEKSRKEDNLQLSEEQQIEIEKDEEEK